MPAYGLNTETAWVQQRTYAAKRVNAPGINGNHFHQTSDKSAKHIDAKVNYLNWIERAYREGEKDTHTASPLNREASDRQWRLGSRTK